MRKRILSLLLCIVLCLSMLPATAFAKDLSDITFSGGDSTYFESLEIDGYNITDCTEEMSGTGWSISGNNLTLSGYNGSGISATMKDRNSLNVIVASDSKITSSSYALYVSGGGLTLQAPYSTTKLEIDFNYYGIYCTGLLTISNGTYILTGRGSNPMVGITQTHMSIESFNLYDGATVIVDCIGNSSGNIYGIKGVGKVDGDRGELGQLYVKAVNNGTGNAYAHDISEQLIEYLEGQANTFIDEPGLLSVNYPVEASTYSLTVENGTATIYATSTPATDVEAGTNIMIEANEISGKQFKNWEIVSGGPFTVDTLYTPRATFNMPANDVRIRAVYEDSANSTYNLTVENGTATIYATSTPATDVEAGTNIMIEANEISGKQFKNWEIVSGGPFTVDTLYTPRATFNMPANDVTIRAVYQEAPTTYTVSFDMNGHGDQVAAQPVNEGAQATKPADPTATGYMFGGWYKDSAFTTAWSFDTDAVTEDTTLYALWVENIAPPAITYTVSFNMNGHGNQVSAQTVKEGEKATKPADPTASGWTFNGWYADATFSAEFDFNTAIAADTMVYAKWTANSVTPPTPANYTVTFNMNGHGTQVAAQTVKEGETATKPADPSASGYTFDGWYADATFSAKFNFDSAITANTTVYAKWTEVKKDEPTDPADPTNPTQPTKPADPTSPQTGDNSHLFLWIALLLISGSALAGTAVYGKKRKYNAK